MSGKKEFQRMKYALNIILGVLILISLCKANVYSQVEKMDTKDELSNSKIYFASKRINECFSRTDSTTIGYIAKFLERDSIKVIITHSIAGGVQTFYLKGNEKLDFFYSPEVFNDKKTRRKSDYYNVKGNCYEFNNEGISHNSIYLKELCFVNNEGDISLLEIYLLDGD